jgi:heme/copper-type cytochrome/quinol oxidase subunit 3
MMEKNKMGVATFLGSESVFFSLLILAYAYYRPGVTGAVTANKVLSPILMAPFSVMLWTSSATVWRAGENLKQGNRSRAWLWLVATIALGLGFLIGEGIEWSGLISQGIFIDDNLFTTTFFTLTGFHGLHVTAGLIALSILLGLGLRALAQEGKFRAPSFAALDALSLYWHFVDGVWIIIFSVVYLTVVFS